MVIFVVDGKTKAEHPLENNANMAVTTSIDVIVIDKGRRQLLLLLTTLLRLFIAIVVEWNLCVFCTTTVLIDEDDDGLPVVIYWLLGFSVFDVMVKIF